MGGILRTGTAAAYLFRAPTSGTYTTADADALFYGERAGDWAGLGVVMGDIDAGGWGDLLVAAPSDDTGGSAGVVIYMEYSPL